VRTVKKFNRSPSGKTAITQSASNKLRLTATEILDMPRVQAGPVAVRTNIGSLERQSKGSGSSQGVKKTHVPSPDGWNIEKKSMVWIDEKMKRLVSIPS